MIPGWGTKWQPTPVFLPEKSHGQRSLVGYSPWGRKESDTTDQLHFHFLSWGTRFHMQPNIFQTKMGARSLQTLWFGQ